MFVKHLFITAIVLFLAAPGADLAADSLGIQESSVEVLRTAITLSAPDGVTNDATNVPGILAARNAPHDPDRAWRTLADLPFGVLEECGGCNDLCDAGGTAGHYAFESQDYYFAKRDGWHLDKEEEGVEEEDWCLPGSCFEHHHPCEPDDAGCADCTDPDFAHMLGEGLPAMWAAVRSGALQAGDLAARFPQSIEINEERGALQIIGCGGMVVAHVPLDQVSNK